MSNKAESGSSNPDNYLGFFDRLLKTEPLRLVVVHPALAPQEAPTIESLADDISSFAPEIQTTLREVAGEL
jgi:hypothetical protein